MGISLDLLEDDISPSALWAALNEDVRREAAEAVYRGGPDAVTWRQEADAAIAAAIRFRPTAIRSLPATRRIGYLLRAVRPDDALASSLLLALHLKQRQPLLESFLDHLGIPQEGGLIAEDYDLDSPDSDRVESAARELYEKFPADQVDLYLTSLVAMDGDTWTGLIEILRRLMGERG